MRDEDGVRRGELPKGQRRAVPLILSEVRIDEDACFAAREHQRRRPYPSYIPPSNFPHFKHNRQKKKPEMPRVGNKNPPPPRSRGGGGTKLLFFNRKAR